MNNQEGYDLWSTSYDQDENKTRDLEAIAIRKVLGNMKFSNCLEIGCGTGKNTSWLSQRANQVTAVDFSEEMMRLAKQKVSSANVHFQKADITKKWNFGKGHYDLITFSLVLEHLKDLEFIFNSSVNYLKSGGYIYIGELHPYKQYSGTRARFIKGEQTNFLECYTHNISDFTESARKVNLQILGLNEFFDDENIIPRILTLLFRYP